MTCAIEVSLSPALLLLLLGCTDGSESLYFSNDSPSNQYPQFHITRFPLFPNLKAGTFLPSAGVTAAPVP